MNVKRFSITAHGAKEEKAEQLPRIVVTSGPFPVGISSHQHGRMALQNVNAFGAAFSVQLKAKTKSDMFNGLYREGSKRFVPQGGKGYIFSTRWERAHKPKGVQVGASIPGFGVGKLVGDKLLHRWVCYLCTNKKDGVGMDFVCGFQDYLSCRQLAVILQKFHAKGGLDAAGRSVLIGDVMGHLGTGIKLFQ